MVQNSYTRITLALDIVKKLDKGEFAGYHELAIIKHQIDLYDVICIENASDINICCNNPMVPCDSRNICWKAVELIKKEFGINKSIKIDLQKNIPVMGGLAGGSANAATILMLLNEHWNLGLGAERLMELGRRLGMDVPYYFLGGTAFDSEASGVLKMIPTKLKFVFILAVPDFGVATKDAYQNIDYSVINSDRSKTDLMSVSLQSNDFCGVTKNMHNDFEKTVFKRFPRLEEMKQQLISAGCFQAIMSGSGSTIIGVTDNLEHARQIKQKLSFNTIISSSL